MNTHIEREIKFRFAQIASLITCHLRSDDQQHRTRHKQLLCVDLFFSLFFCLISRIHQSPTSIYVKNRINENKIVCIEMRREKGLYSINHRDQLSFNKMIIRMRKDVINPKRIC